MKVLVTGVNGQLGYDVMNELNQRGHEAIGSDITESNEHFQKYVQLDITNKEAVESEITKINPDVVVHCAAWTAVDLAEDDDKVEKVRAVNAKGTENIALTCKKIDCKMIYISTDYVFQGDKNTPCQEEWDTNPLGIYGKTKLAGEQSILESGCRYLIFRTAWLYSMFGNNFVKTMQRLTQERDTLKVVFDQVGTPTYAGDLAALIVKIINENQLAKQGIYHFSNEGICSWYDFAKEIATLSNHTCDIQPCHSNEFPSKVKRPHFSVLDKSKVKETFNITIPHWKDSLIKCINELEA